MRSGYNIPGVSQLSPRNSDVGALRSPRSGSSSTSSSRATTSLFLPIGRTSASKTTPPHQTPNESVSIIVGDEKLIVNGTSLKLFETLTTGKSAAEVTDIVNTLQNLAIKPQPLLARIK